MMIVLNGELTDVSEETTEELRQNRFPDADTVIVDGEPVSEDTGLEEYSRVYICSMPEGLTGAITKRCTEGVSSALGKATVGIAGAGGLGSNIATYLARSGVGRIIIADFDRVEPSNLNRQNYDLSHLGLFKVDAISEVISRINPDIEVIARAVKIDRRGGGYNGPPRGRMRGNDGQQGHTVTFQEGMKMDDDLIIGNRHFKSRFILGSGKFSLEMTDKVIRNGGVEIATLAVRRVNKGGQENVLDYMPKNVTLLPNTSGARTAEEALTIARLARELGCGDMIKIEIVRDTRYLLPDNAETIRAIELLVDDGFTALPYMMPDLTAAKRMADAGAAAIMPLAAPIGSNRGLLTRDFIKMMVDEIDLPIIVDAGIGRPSQACEAMEMGCAAVMANTAIATASDVAEMATAFRMAIEAGRKAYLAGPGRVLSDRGEASSPLTGFLGE